MNAQDVRLAMAVAPVTAIPAVAAMAAMPTVAVTVIARAVVNGRRSVIDRCRRVVHGRRLHIHRTRCVVHRCRRIVRCVAHTDHRTRDTDAHRKRHIGARLRGTCGHQAGYSEGCHCAVAAGAGQNRRLAIHFVLL